MSATLTSTETQKTVSTRPSEQFRNELLVVKKHLSHAEEWTKQLSSVPPVEQQKRLSNIVRIYKDHIIPQTEWEEQKLYPAVDKRIAQSNRTFTSGLRYENHIIDRWTDELELEFAQKIPDVKTFEHRSYQLLGLIKAHFEVEEEVLLPILDQSMTTFEFQEEIFSGHGQH